VPTPPVAHKHRGGANEEQSAAETLAIGAESVVELIVDARSRDGREVVGGLNALYAAGRLARDESGRHVLKGGSVGG
jgi:hypothetical protein